VKLSMRVVDQETGADITEQVGAKPPRAEGGERREGGDRPFRGDRPHRDRGGYRGERNDRYEGQDQPRNADPISE